MYPVNGTERARNDIATAFTQYPLLPNMQKLVSTRVLPQVNVDLAHGTYPVRPVKESMKRVEKTGKPIGHELDRAPGGTYRRFDSGFTEATYHTEERGLAGVVDRNQQQHYRHHFDHEQETAIQTLHQVLVEREERTAGQCFSTTVFTGNNTDDGLSQDAGTYQADLTYNAGGATPWSDWASSVPRDDIFYAKKKVFNRTGIRPRRLLINEEVFLDLRMNDQLRSEWISLGVAHGHQGAIAPQDLGQMSDSGASSALAQVLDLDEIIVGASVIDGNAPGLAFQATHIWGRSALLFTKIMRTGTQSLADNGLGHTLQWDEGASNDPNAINNTHGMVPEAGFFVEDYWDTERRAQMIRVRHQDFPLIKYAEMGELITTV